MQQKSLKASLPIKMLYTTLKSSRMERAPSKSEPIFAEVSQR